MTAAARALALLTALVLAAPAARAQSRGPKKGPTNEKVAAPGVKRPSPPLTPRAEPPVNRAPDEYACAKDADCVFLPPACASACPPCKPTWRPVGNMHAVRRLKTTRAMIPCPAAKCRPCASRSNWLGKRPICARGRCWVEGNPLPKGGPPPVEGKPAPTVTDGDRCYQACLRSNMARAEAWESIQAGCRHQCKVDNPLPERPVAPRSKYRACRRDEDCVFVPRTPCTCPPCHRTWRRAFNRQALKAWRNKWSTRKCRQTEVCAACVPQWIGARAVCEKGQCTVQP